MFRKNHSNQGSRPKGAASGGKWGQRKESNRPARKVSPNYRVNMMHHNTSGADKPTRPSYGPGSKPSRPVGVFTQPKPPQRPRSAMGYHPAQSHSVAIANDLFQPLQDKLSADGKTAEEVVNKLLALYIEGKIVLEPVVI